MADGRLLFDTHINTSGFVSGLKGLGSLAGKAVAGVGKVIVGATAGLTAFGVSAVKTGMEFEAQMSRVQAISGATSTELKALEDLAIKLGADTAFSAKEAADGMENLASAGFNTKEIMAAMPGLLDLAAVSGGDVARASEVAASAIRAFGLEASAAGHVADVFAKAAADTNAEVADMGEAMKYVAPVAKAMGQSIEETAAAIGIMSDAGIKGSQAGTALRGAFSRLVKPTKLMRATMEDLGLEFFDAQGNMKPLNGIISELQKGTKGLTQEQKNQALVTLFGQESLSGMLALVEAGPDKLNELTKSLKDSDGAADKMAKTIQGNLASGVEQLGGSLETLKIRIYKSVDGPLKDLVGKVTDYVNKMTEAFTAKGFAGIFDVLGDMIAEGVVGLATTLPKITEVGVRIVETLVASIESNLSAISKSVGDVASVLVKALSKIIPKVISIGAKLVTCIAKSIVDNLPTLVSSASEIIKTVGAAIAENLPLLVRAALQIVLGLANGLIAAMPSMVPQLMLFITTLGNMLIQNAPLLVNAAIELITALINGLVSMLPLLIPMTIEIIMAIANGIMSNLPLLLDAVLQLITAIVTGIVENLPLLIDGALSIILALVDFLINNLDKLIEVAVNLINAIIEGLINNLDKLVDAALKLILAIVEGLINNLPKIISAAVKLILTLTGALLKMLPEIISAGLRLIGGLVEGILSKLPEVVMAAGQLALGLIGSILGFVGQVISCGIKLVLSLLDGILRTAGKLISGVAKMIGNVVKAITKGLSGMADIGINLVKGLWNGISGMAEWIKDKIFGFAKSITSAIKSFFGINSPSREMRDEVGKWLPPGIAIGFDKEMPSLERDIEKQLGSLKDTMQKTVEAESTLTAGKIAANSNVYLPNPYDRKTTKEGLTAAVSGDVYTTVELDGRAVGYSVSNYSSEEQALEDKRRKY